MSKTYYYHVLIPIAARTDPNVAPIGEIVQYITCNADDDVVQEQVEQGLIYDCYASVRDTGTFSIAGVIKLISMDHAAYLASAAAHQSMEGQTHAKH